MSSFSAYQTQESTEMDLIRFYTNRDIVEQKALLVEAIPELIPDLIGIINEYTIEKLKVSDMVFCMTTDGKWNLAEIWESVSTKVRVQYKDSKESEWIEFSPKNKRIKLK